MVTATTNFYQAVLHFQKVFLEQQRSRQLSQATRNYYREKKERTLQEFSRYEFLFSEPYRRLREDGFSNIPVIFNQEITALIKTGTSYQETYQEIARVFDLKIREATKNLLPVDPDYGKVDNTTEKYQADIKQLMRSYANRVIDLTRDGKSINEIIIETEALKPRLILEIEATVKQRIATAVDAGGIVAGTYISNLIKNRG